jgi:hypothetical protein
MAEYLLASKIAQEIKEEQSNDPFTCRLRDDLYSSGGISIDPNLRGGASGRAEMLVCLDIAAAGLCQGPNLSSITRPRQAMATPMAPFAQTPPPTTHPPHSAAASRAMATRTVTARSTRTT